jgi:hypothetical protein
MDFNHDADGGCDNCSCAGSGYSAVTDGDVTKLKTFLNVPSSGAGSAAGPVSKSHFESILKFILTDYMRLKNENESLKSEVDGKNRTIDELRKSLDAQKVCISLFFVIFFKENLK